MLVNFKYIYIKEKLNYINIIFTIIISWIRVEGIILEFTPHAYKQPDRVITLKRLGGTIVFPRRSRFNLVPEILSPSTIANFNTLFYIMDPPFYTSGNALHFYYSFKYLIFKRFFYSFFF